MNESLASVNSCVISLIVEDFSIKLTKYRANVFTIYDFLLFIIKIKINVSESDVWWYKL